VNAVKNACKIPVIVGSGVTLENLKTYLPKADALIVGSWFKEGSYWENALNYDKITRFMEEAKRIRS
ncbi:BtpA/SgcQ family protein, partial [Lutibacter sp.]